MWIDSHCHLNDEKFLADLDDVKERAENAGVQAMISICTHLNEFDQILKIVQKYPNIYGTVGVHPHEAQHVDPSEVVSALTERLGHQKIVGIGETGLDYYYENSPKQEQLRSFEKHIEVALAHDLPLIVHTRDAEPETMDILKSAGPGLKGIIHCFSGTQWLADEALKLGFYISISGIVTFKKAHDLRDIIKTIPLERLLVETDAPYLSPVPLRGQRNEPAFMVHTAQAVANLKDIHIEDLAQVTTKNCCDIFNISVESDTKTH